MRLLLILLMTVPLSAVADIYECKVTRKVYATGEDSPADLKKWQPSTILEINQSSPSYASRCAYSTIAKKVTCDRYEMDRVDVDPNVGHIKMYRFTSQMTVQLFANLNFMEDMGRGIVSFGKCKALTPPTTNDVK
ncbi:hypothetical protein [Stigmatella hybrida]|uniref:hypothetical protein n=1 Tax=Stigmatella hybrida TaxID=394097 RepID=UPI001CDA87B1|nr:hypothetical protein [Stigmatella hybrida]